MPQKSKDLKSRKIVKIVDSKTEVSTKPMLFIRRTRVVETKKK